MTPADATVNATRGTKAVQKTAAGVAPLENGDRLTATEFEHRFDATPGLRKAELINGVVHMAPPVREDHHAFPHFDLGTLFGIYRFATPGVRGGIEGTLRLDPRNRPQPDIYLRILPECGGQSKTDAHDYVTGGPELVAEVAASSASYDFYDKLDLYRAYDVREYMIWRTIDQELDWFELTPQGYRPIPPGEDGVLRSRVLPGLWLNRAALFDGDSEKLLQTLQEGIASSEHKAFVDRLKAARTAGT